MRLPRAVGRDDLRPLRRHAADRRAGIGQQMPARRADRVAIPARMKLRQWPAGVAPGAELAAEGLVAETFPVSVEQDDVVVEA